MNVSTTTKTKIMHQTKPVSSPRPEWRPEPIGLTRQELRALVAEMLG